MATCNSREVERRRSRVGRKWSRAQAARASSSAVEIRPQSAIECQRGEIALVITLLSICQKGLKTRAIQIAGRTGQNTPRRRKASLDVLHLYVQYPIKTNR